MRCVCLAASLCLGAWISNVCGAPPGGQFAPEQLIKAQQEDDQQVQAVQELEKRLGGAYGDASQLRVVADELTRLEHLRTARAAKYWELLGITLPLRRPLTESQREQLEAFIGAFKDTENDPLARAALEEHQTLVQIGAAKAMLEKLQLQSTAEELSEAQIATLIELEQTFSTTGSAEVARRYLRAHFKRRLIADLQLGSIDEELTAKQLEQLIAIDSKPASSYDRKPGVNDPAEVLRHPLEVEVARTYLLAHFNRRTRGEMARLGLLTPENQERLASQRLAHAQEQFRMNRVNRHLRRKLVQIIADYPGTGASKQASMQLADLDRFLQAEAAQARFIRDYWDAVYPMRTCSPVAAQR